MARKVRIEKDAGQPLGLEVSSSVFDRVRTCDNHCAFCFIYQLPKGLRRSLYLKDDDYRLSFLYGNFTTLTRFTELDAERVLEERLSPLFVSIHATDPAVRAKMLRNPKGATSLRWLRVLVDGGIEVHGQVVVCPGVNDGAVLQGTLDGVLDEYPRLSTLGVVPLGLSRFSREDEMRPHTTAEAAAVCDAVEEFQELSLSLLGRRLAYASDEYYLLARRPLPTPDRYDDFAQHENGIGMARAFEESFTKESAGPGGVRHGFFSWVDGAPAEGYRARRAPDDLPGLPDDRSGRPIRIMTGVYGAAVLRPLVIGHGHPDTEVVAIENRFFGGNIAVAGLLTGVDLAAALAAQPKGARCLIPDSCLSGGRFLDGLTLDDLGRHVEVIPSDGRSLRAALDADRVAFGQLVR